MPVQNKTNEPAFSIEGAKDLGNAVVDNFQAAAFTAKKATQRFAGSMVKNIRPSAIMNGSNRYARCSVAMQALPDSAEGSWGDVQRRYVVGGNWKSNGDNAFIESFNENIVSDDCFDPSEMDVAVGAPSVYLSAAKSKVAKGINVMS